MPNGREKILVSVETTQWARWLQCVCNMIGCVCTYRWLDSCKHEKESYPRGLCWHVRYFRCPPTAGWWVCDQHSSSSSSTAFASPLIRFKLPNRVSIRLPTFESHVDCLPIVYHTSQSWVCLIREIFSVDRSNDLESRSKTWSIYILFTAFRKCPFDIVDVFD